MYSSSTSQKYSFPDRPHSLSQSPHEREPDKVPAQAGPIKSGYSPLEARNQLIHELAYEADDELDMTWNRPTGLMNDQPTETSRASPVCPVCLHTRQLKPLPRRPKSEARSINPSHESAPNLTPLAFAGHAASGLSHQKFQLALQGSCTVVQLQEANGTVVTKQLSRLACMRREWRCCSPPTGTATPGPFDSSSANSLIELAH